MEGGDGFGAMPLPPVFRVVSVYISSGWTVSFTEPSAPTGSSSERFWKSWFSGGLSPRLFEQVRLEYLWTAVPRAERLSDIGDEQRGTDGPPERFNLTYSLSLSLCPSVPLSLSVCHFLG